MTIGQILGMAAHLEHKQVTVLDMTGMAQKGGAVMSHVQIAEGAPLFATKLGAASADAVIGCDLLVTGGAEALARMSNGVTRVVLNTALQPTGDFARQPDWQFPAQALEQAVQQAVGRESLWSLDASQLATALLGDAMATNLFLLGFAYQKGLVPLTAASIERAVELNGTAVTMNLQAFRWGRSAAVDLRGVVEAAKPAQVIRFVPRQAASLTDLVERRVRFLTQYQNAGYAERYRRTVERVREAEANLGSTRLAEVVANNLFKLMAYKDEYEVARLYADPQFKARLEQEFDGLGGLRFHLAPPLLSRRNDRGEPVKREFGSWVLPLFGVLARLRGLRGTLFDPFGHTAERKMERQLVTEYEQTVSELLAGLSRDRLELALKIASLPARIRGFGHVKERNVQAAQRERELLFQAWHGQQAERQAA